MDHCALIRIVIRSHASSTCKNCIQSGHNSDLVYDIRNCRWQTVWLCENEEQAITQERKLFSDICQLKTFGVQQRPRW